MDIWDEIERVAARATGKPLMQCLRDVVRVAARMHSAAKLSFDEIRERAAQTAWEAAVEYSWAVTAVERATARSFLRTYTAEWIVEALSPLGMFRTLKERHGTNTIQRVIEMCPPNIV